MDRIVDQLGAKTRTKSLTCYTLLRAVGTKLSYERGLTCRQFQASLSDALSRDCLHYVRLWRLDKGRTELSAKPAENLAAVESVA